jgi:hypothetical protein
MRSIFAVAALVCFVPFVSAADEENPYKKAKVGDWVEYKMTGPNIEGTTKMTIVAKDEKEVAYEVAGTFSFMGNKMTAPIQTMKIDLTKKYDAAAQMKPKDGTLDKDGEGNEKIKVGNKEYETKWTKWKASTTANNITITSEYKMWFCKDVPLGGLVKMDTTVSTITTKLELTGSGSK